jgi:hypothetical protein
VLRYRVARIGAARRLESDGPRQCCVEAQAALPRQDGEEKCPHMPLRCCAAFSRTDDVVYRDYP